MELAEHFTDDARALHIRPVPNIIDLMLGIEDAAMHRFQPVAHVRQRPTNNHAHGVIEVRLAHLLLKIDGDGFFCELFHVLRGGRMRKLYVTY